MSNDNDSEAPDHGMVYPFCKGELEMGFGLAGGGYGPYSYCPSCSMVVDKTQEPTE